MSAHTSPVYSADRPRTQTVRLRVGEVARIAGITVRTLHHYESLGLLPPADRSESSHRVYGSDGLLRLSAGLALRRLGLGQKNVRQIVRTDARGHVLMDGFDEHLHATRERVRRSEELAQRLEQLVGVLRRRQNPDLGDIVSTLEAMTMAEKNPFSEEQQERPARLAEALGPDGMAAAEREWPELITAVRAHMEAGTDPQNPDVRRLAARWRELVRGFTGGDADIAVTLQSRHADPACAQAFGLSSDLFRYVASLGGRVVEPPEASGAPKRGASGHSPDAPLRVVSPRRAVAARRQKCAS